MSWSALVGAFVGAGIPAILTYIRIVRDRQGVDAQAFGPAFLLLDRMDPVRVTMNVGDAMEEQARWNDLNQKVDTARERLLVVAAGHPRRHVRKLAQQAQAELANVRQASSWAVSDLLQNKSNPEWMEHARKTHEAAGRALSELVEATFTRKSYLRIVIKRA